MSVLARVGKRKAIFRHGVWRCADRHLEHTLNEATLSWIRDTGGPKLDETDQEGSVAREMVGRFGGCVLLKMRAKSPQASRYFFEQRQMVLPF